MKFQVTDAHIKIQNRKDAYVALPLVALSFFLVLIIATSDKLSEMLYPGLGLLVFVQILHGKFKIFKEGRESYPIFEINTESETVHVTHKNTTVSFPLSDIDKLRLQYKSGRLVSILMNTKSDQKITINGYENIEEMADIFQRFTPTGNIKVATWFHL